MLLPLNFHRPSRRLRHPRKRLPLLQSRLRHLHPHRTKPPCCRSNHHQHRGSTQPPTRRRRIPLRQPLISHSSTRLSSTRLSSTHRSRLRFHRRWARCRHRHVLLSHLPRQCCRHPPPVSAETASLAPTRPISTAVACAYPVISKNVARMQTTVSRVCAKPGCAVSACSKKGNRSPRAIMWSRPSAIARLPRGSPVSAFFP